MLKNHFALVGSTKKHDIKDEFVACIEHLKYPIVANQWHPEKNANEKGVKYHFLDKSSRTIYFLNSILGNMMNTVRDSSTPKSNWSNIIKTFLSSNFDPIQTNYTANDRVFVSPRITFDDEFNE